MRDETGLFGFTKRPPPHKLVEVGWHFGYMATFHILCLSLHLSPLALHIVSSAISVHILMRGRLCQFNNPAIIINRA